jgi:hypothetical protein
MVPLCLISGAVSAQDKVTVYFYSSETNINNFKSLKMEFDRYLSAHGLYEFQPFSDREAFENYVKDKKACLLLMSSWHYKNIWKEYALQPVLVGIRNGKKSQKRILVGRGKSADLASAKTGRIASATSVRHTRSVLSEIFGDNAAAESSKILTVPKDIDALMSVGFGMSQSALTTGNSLETLKSVNSVLYDKMKILAQASESLLLILAVPESFSADAQKAVRVIQNMPSNEDGKEKIKMLGLDRWEQIAPSDKAALEN